MLKWIMISVAATGISTHLGSHACAQHGQAQTPPAAMLEMHRKDVQKIGTAINASPQQVQQMLDLQVQYFQAMHQLMHSVLDDKSKQQVAPKFKQLRANAEISLQKIITKDQFKKLQEQGLLGVFFGDKMAMGPFELLAKLNLTPEQTDQAKQIIARTMKQAEALHLEKNLTPDQMKQKHMELHEQTIHEIAAILTPEQLQQLHEMMRQLHEGEGQKVPPPAKR